MPEAISALYKGIGKLNARGNARGNRKREVRCMEQWESGDAWGDKR